MAVSTSPKQTQQIAKDLAHNLRGGEIITLIGTLGAGKTTFIQGLAQGLGIKRRITSPTFIMVRPYGTRINKKPITFYHVDLFRTKPSDLATLGLSEIFGPDSVVAIEWAEKIRQFLPKKRIEVKIDVENETTRRIKITPAPLSFPPSHLSFPRKRESINIKSAAQVLKTGGVVIFPTDTVYGIGCRADFPKSVARIYQIKGTPKTQAFPILVSSVEQTKEIVTVSKAAQKLMDKFWPGALTIILPIRHLFEPEPQSRRPESSIGHPAPTPVILSPSMSLRAKRSNLKVNSAKDLKIGIRMPDSQLIRNLIEKVGVPIIGTSANIHGKPSVKSPRDLDPALKSQVDYILEGECDGGVESTVVDATFDPPKVLRQGAINISSLKNSYH